MNEPSIVNGDEHAAMIPAAKPTMNILVCKSGQIITQLAKPAEMPRQTIVMPLNLQGDSRLFIKDGEIIRPFVTAEFEHRQTLDITGIDVHLYGEVAMREFDASDMQPIAVRSLDQDFAELNGE